MLEARTIYIYINAKLIRHQKFGQIGSGTNPKVKKAFTSVSYNCIDQVESPMVCEKQKRGPLIPIDLV